MNPILVVTALLMAADADVPATEAPTENVPDTPALDTLSTSRAALEHQAALAKRVPAETAEVLVERAMRGNGDVLILGFDRGILLVQDLGGGGFRALLESVTKLPEKGAAIRDDGRKTGAQIAEAREELDAHGRELWQLADTRIADHDGHTREAQKETRATMDAERVRIATSMTEGVGSAYSDARKREASLTSWGDEQMDTEKHALVDGTREQFESGLTTTLNTQAQWHRETAAAFNSVAPGAGQMWEQTRSVSQAVAARTPTESARVFMLGTADARRFTGWLNANRAMPFVVGPEAVRQFSAYNWDRGWVNGVQPGMQSAEKAWQHQDQVFAVLWATSGVGRGALHLCLLEPAGVPLILASVLGAAGLVFGLGYPVAGAMLAGGAGAAGLALMTGLVAAGVIAVSGAGLMALAAGVGAGRAIGIALVGALVTGAVGAASMTTVGVHAVISAAWLLTVPAIMYAGIASAKAWGGLKIASLIFAAGTGLVVTQAVGMAELARNDALHRLMALHLRASTGTQVFIEHAVVLPLTTVDASMRHAGRSVKTLTADPIKGVAQTTGALFVLLHTLGGVGFIAGLTVLQGGVELLGHGAMGTGSLLLALVALHGIPVEWTARAVNIPLHRAWADARAEETERVLTTMQAHGAPLDAGSIILTRTHWWGDETGKVRFFVTRNASTGKRWYFERQVDAATCDVSYRGTDEDPVLRLRPNVWKGAWKTGLKSGECMQQRAQAG